MKGGEFDVVWPVLMLLIVTAVVLAAVVGATAYVAHVREHAPPLHAAAGSHRAAEVGRHRPGGALSVDQLRAREHADAMPMYPRGGGGRS